MPEERSHRDARSCRASARVLLWVLAAAATLFLAVACTESGVGTESGETPDKTVPVERRFGRSEAVTSDSASPDIGGSPGVDGFVFDGGPAIDNWPGDERSQGNEGFGIQLRNDDDSTGSAFALPNRRPVAEAGPDMEALAGDVVELTGESSLDPEGADLTYRWTITSGPAGGETTLRGAGTVEPLFLIDLPGVYEVELVVGDGIDESESDVVVISVGTWFTDVTSIAKVPGGGPIRRDGVAYRDGNGTGLAWGDYDGDALPDLYLTRYGDDILYRNEGDGTFTNVASDAGVAKPALSTAAAWVDFDNDGLLDLYVLNAEDDRRRAMPSGAGNGLYRSNGDGTFSGISDESGPDVSGGNAALWVDLFNGRSDLLVVGSGRGGAPVRLFSNEPDSTFRDVTEASGLGSGLPVNALATGAEAIVDAILLDYDADGYQDVLLSSADGSVRLLRYHFPGREFQDVTPGSGLETLADVSSAIAGDYDNDGYQDLFLSGEDTGELWRNDTEGGFSDVTHSVGLGAPGTGAGFFDFDNDGLLDLFLVNGAGSDRIGGLPNQLHRNDGDGTFTDVTIQSGLGNTGEAAAVGFADYDYDGDLDVYVVNADGANVLYRNDLGSRNGWLRILLRGISSNLLGIGARVEIATPDGLTRVAFPAGGPEFGGQSDARLLVGLGDSDRANIKVIWPSGLVQEFWGAIPNESVRLREVAMEGW